MPLSRRQLNRISSIILSKKSGQYLWRYQEQLDGQEFPIIGFGEGEGDSIEVIIKEPGSTRKIIIVYNEVGDVLYIDQKPFTDKPSAYPVVDDSSNCNGNE